MRDWVRTLVESNAEPCNGGKVSDPEVRREVAHIRAGIRIIRESAGLAKAGPTEVEQKFAEELDQR